MSFIVFWLSVSKTGLWWWWACRLLIDSVSRDCRYGIFLWYQCVFLCLRCVVFPFYFDSSMCIVCLRSILGAVWVGSVIVVECTVLCETLWERPPWLSFVLWIRVSRHHLLVAVPGPVDVCTVASKRSRRTLETFVFDGWNARLARRVDFCGLRCMQTGTRSTIESDTEGKPELLPLKTHHTRSNVLLQA